MPWVGGGGSAIRKAVRTPQEFLGADGTTVLPDCGNDHLNLHLIKCHRTIQQKEGERGERGEGREGRRSGSVSELVK